MRRENSQGVVGNYNLIHIAFNPGVTTAGLDVEGVENPSLALPRNPKMMKPTPPLTSNRILILVKRLWTIYKM